MALLNLILNRDKKNQIENVKKLKLVTSFFSSKIAYNISKKLSKEDILLLIADQTDNTGSNFICDGLNIVPTVEEDGQIIIYLEPSYNNGVDYVPDSGVGPVPGPGVGPVPGPGVG